MDKFTKNYIDDIVKPMLNRIEQLERTNSQLQIQVRHLESLISNSGNYQKPTVSAANHMRDSRLSTKIEDSAEKRPGWNSKTKISQSPAAANREPLHHEKVKNKPPIPKLVKSPNKYDAQDETRSSGTEKKILGGVKCQPEAVQPQTTLQEKAA